MKKVMFALCFIFGGIVAVSAQETQDTTSNQYRTETESQNPQDAQGQDQPQDQSQDMQAQDQSQEMQTQDQSQNTMGQQDRERIQVTELPEEVKRSLEGQEYRGWLISGAFKAQSGQSGDQSTSPEDQAAMQSDTTNAQGREPSANATGTEEEEVYIVELKNGAETKTVHFDSKGEIVEGMESEQNSQYNQSEPMNQPDSDPSKTDQPDQSQSSQSATPSQPDQSAEQSSETETETQTEQSSQRQNDQSSDTETQTQSTDQSKSNEPK